MRSIAAVAVSLLALSGCSTQVSETAIVSQAQLETQVSALFTAADPEVEVVATCAGDLGARVGATQDCHLDIGKQDADVRVRVTEIVGKQTKFVTTPFVPATRVAKNIARSLRKQGYRVDQVVCQSELIGEVGAKAICVLAPADRDGKVRAKVKSVKGLKVNFDYRVLG
ncbi:DUF4333 domain-containing protein [Nocardioides sp.]|uniref:DUF4333 domain-containing protein n=1 Tax=Nocardioides sp. TaxID=35761 RepID=UPI003561FE00